MSQLLLNKMRNAAGVFGLLVLFLIAGTVDANAQGQSQRARNDGSNPYALSAQKLGVSACAPGTATNVQGGLDYLNQQMPALKQKLVDGTATLLEKVKYEYYVTVSTEVGSYYVAPEVSTLTALSYADKKVGNETITSQQLAALYNGLKSQFGMCQ